MDFQVDDAIEVYREYSSYPVVKKAVVCNAGTPGHVEIYSEWSQHDLERMENVKFSHTHIAQLDVVFPTTPQELNNEQLSVESPSGKLRAVLRKLKDKKGEDQQYIEVWTDTKKLHCINLTKLDQHGKVYEDDTFGCLQWSHSETHLLYVAEKKQTTSKSFFDKKAAADIESGKQDVCRGEEFVYREDWGEQLVGKYQPVICVLDVEAGIVSTLDNLPEYISPGQAVWCPDDQGIVCVGWWQDPYRLGIIYCPIRRSALFHINLKTFQYKILGADDRAVRCPRFSPDNSKLIFLDNPASGAHFQCSRLMMIDWATFGELQVVDIVQEAKPDEFPGVFCLNLTGRCWSKDSRRVFLSSSWRTKTEILVIDTETGVVTRLTNDEKIGSWTLLDVHNDLLVAVRASPNMPHHLVLGVPPTSADGQIKWVNLEPDPVTLPEIKWRIIPITVPAERVNQKYPNLDYECCLVEPAQKDTATKLPLIVFPHGGPHVVFPADFMLYVAGLVKCGYAVLMVNYRGSAGFGQASIDSLPGNVGTQDVQDVQGAAEHVVQTGDFDREKMFVFGGSHGGFLTTHLIGQYPEVYKAACCRNPAINLASMLNTTDIPDWTHVESGVGLFDFKSVSAPEFYQKMYDASPIQHVDKMKTPLMIMLGAKDLRVPPKQGHELRKALQVRGVPVRTLCYGECSHPLTATDVEADAFVNLIQWFNKYKQERS